MNYFWLIFGFGFVVFFHELGHFMAAKWVGIRCEQFAVGFGQALLAYRKKIGWRIGSTNKEVRKICTDHLASKGIAREGPSENKESEPEYSDTQIQKTMDELGYGETEYRLNWIPLGGYVKMLGQDDTNASATSSHPNAFTSKSIPARMLVVSAGVIMNIILAAIGFMWIFYNGHQVPAPVVGTVFTNSPAQKAGVQVGDRIVRINGKTQPDFNSLILSTALMKKETVATVEVERYDETGKKINVTLKLRPEKMSAEAKGLLGMGVGPASTLKNPDMSPELASEMSEEGSRLKDYEQVKSGETIIEVNGIPVAPNRFDILHKALQAGNGQPVDITVQAKNGEKRHEKVSPYLETSVWGDETAYVDFAGMEPRVMIAAVQKESDAVGKLLAGDVIVGLKLKDLKLNPNNREIREMFFEAGSSKEKITVQVDRNGEVKQVEGLIAKMPLKRGNKKLRGMGLGLGLDMKPITSNVIAASPAGIAKVPSGFSIKAVDGKPVSNWLEVRRQLASSVGKHVLTGTADARQPASDYTIELQQVDVDSLSRVQAACYLSMEGMKEIRITKNPVEAAQWGARETSDFVLQFYVTLRRMGEGSVPVNAMMGPLGIVSNGAEIAKRGTSWLIWFLAMISANLAVVNFLPIPIVDGGLFTFLVLEKIKGKPLSPKFLNAAQMVGLALILSVFLLVTFQDIRNMIGF